MARQLLIPEVDEEEAGSEGEGLGTIWKGREKTGRTWRVSSSEGRETLRMTVAEGGGERAVWSGGRKRTRALRRQLLPLLKAIRLLLEFLSPSSSSSSCPVREGKASASTFTRALGS
jgi:hypothetical protein